MFSITFGILTVDVVLPTPDEGRELLATYKLSSDSLYTFWTSAVTVLFPYFNISAELEVFLITLLIAYLFEELKSNDGTIVILFCVITKLSITDSWTTVPKEKGLLFFSKICIESPTLKLDLSILDFNWMELCVPLIESIIS